MTGGRRENEVTFEGGIFLRHLLIAVHCRAINVVNHHLHTHTHTHAADD